MLHVKTKDFTKHSSCFHLTQLGGLKIHVFTAIGGLCTLSIEIFVC